MTFSLSLSLSQLSAIVDLYTSPLVINFFVLPKFDFFERGGVCAGYLPHIQGML